MKYKSPSSVPRPFLSFSFSLFNCCSITVVPTFPPPLPPTLSTPHLPLSVLHPHCLCPWVLYTYMFLDLALPHLSSVILPLPSDHCHFVLYFHVFGSILFVCFVD